MSAFDTACGSEPSAAKASEAGDGVAAAPALSKKELKKQQRRRELNAKKAQRAAEVAANDAERKATTAERKRVLPAPVVGAAEAAAVDATPALEREHVHAVYDRIAPQWSATRYKPWPRVMEFLRALPAGSLVCEAGCGNGKYLGCASDRRVVVLGSDMSGPLLTEAVARDPAAARGAVLRADCLRLPHRAASFDAAISIAVLHHLSTPARRVAALHELLRVVRPGGAALVYAWALEQETDGIGSRGDWSGLATATPSEVEAATATTATAAAAVPPSSGAAAGGGGRGCSADATATAAADDQRRAGGLRAAGVKAAEEGGDSATTTSCGGTGLQDILVPWQPRRPSRAPGIPGTTSLSADAASSGPCEGGEEAAVLRRYCHVYREVELEALAAEAGCELIDQWSDSGNWYVVVQHARAVS